MNYTFIFIHAIFSLTSHSHSFEPKREREEMRALNINEVAHKEQRGTTYELIGPLWPSQAIHPRANWTTMTKSSNPPMNWSDYCDHLTTNGDHPPLYVFVSASISSLSPIDQTTISKSPLPSHYNHPTHPWTDLSLSWSTTVSLLLNLSLSLSHNQFDLNLLFFVSLDFYIRKF